MEEKKIAVISLGGSIVFPDDNIDVNYLQTFKKTIEDNTANGWQFYIVVGGGKICRKYQAALRDLGNSNSEDIDNLGIEALHTNARLLVLAFKPLSSGKVYYRPEDLSKEVVSSNSVIIGGAEKPGHSTDYDAVLFAQKAGATEVINLTNTSHVYDKDPAKHNDAKPVDEITWDDYLDLIPNDFEPGLNTPFDPIASRKAKELGLKTFVADGNDLDNLQRILDGDNFKGTLIH